MGPGPLLIPPPAALLLNLALYPLAPVLVPATMHHTLCNLLNPPEPPLGFLCPALQHGTSSPRATWAPGRVARGRWYRPHSPGSTPCRRRPTPPLIMVRSKPSWSKH